MSNLQSRMTSVKFEPIAERLPVTPSEWILVLGVIYPAVVIALELASRMCTEAFFDPIPTYWHALVVCFVPGSNLLTWKHLRDGTRRNTKWLALANGGAIAIAGFYALIFLPLVPIAIVGIVFGIGLLP